MGELEDKIFGRMTVGAVLDHKRRMESPKPKRKVYWLGNIDTCNICPTKITTTFIDGKTTMGPWAILCPQCHKDVGYGLGTGLGQRYVLQEDGRWLKVEG
ncbi:MAG: hypothetical protein ACXACT_16400 [Candidatus Thorarchaeota archaeon]|jgi:hypothetical protein